MKKDHDTIWIIEMGLGDGCWMPTRHAARTRDSLRERLPRIQTLMRSVPLRIRKYARDLDSR